MQITFFPQKFNDQQVGFEIEMKTLKQKKINAHTDRM